MNYITDIGNNLYVFTKEVKMVLKYDLTSKSIKYIIETATTEKKLVSSFENKTTKSLILMLDGTVFKSHIESVEITNRLEKSGKCLIKMSADNYLSVEYISAIFDYSKTKVVELMNKTNLAASVLQFIRRGSVKNSCILLKTGEIVELSEDSSSIVKEVEKTLIGV